MTFQKKRYNFNKRDSSNFYDNVEDQKSRRLLIISNSHIKHKETTTEKTDRRKVSQVKNINIYKRKVTKTFKSRIIKRQNGKGDKK